MKRYIRGSNVYGSVYFQTNIRVFLVVDVDDFLIAGTNTTFTDVKSDYRNIVPQIHFGLSSCLLETPILHRRRKDLVQQAYTMRLMMAAEIKNGGLDKSAP